MARLLHSYQPGVQLVTRAQKTPPVRAGLVVQGLVCC